MITELQVLVAVLLDALLGEPKRYHPLAGFGSLVLRIEAFFYAGNNIRSGTRKILGIVAWGVAVIPFVYLTFYAMQQSTWIVMIVETLLLYLVIGNQSLAQHAKAVSNALVQKNLPLARRNIQMMVRRDTEKMQDEDISRATIESVLENGNDAVFGAIFWFLVLGAPGVVLYRLANTLDAMWGYKNTRYLEFGWFAARTDDLLNWIPARLTALTYALIGHTATALRCWKVQAKTWKGVNPGVVMATGAGALGLTIGGAAQYHGKEVIRPVLGTGNKPTALSIQASIQLVQRSLWVWLGLIFIEGLVTFKLFS